MPYCSRCGVEVDQKTVSCPLCEAPIQQLPMDDGTPWPAEEAPAPSPPPLSTDERMALAKTITTLGFIIPAAIVITVDWFISDKLTWSRYVLASLGAAWLWAILPLMLHRRPYNLTASITATAVLLQYAIGRIAGNVSWLPIKGIPITLLGGILTGVIIFLARKSRRLGSNLAGWILIALTLILVCIDMLTTFRQSGNWQPGWSLIAGATTLPVSVLLLYLHYRPSARSRMRRYFHV